jgi:hypothetical protein
MNKTIAALCAALLLAAAAGPASARVKHNRHAPPAAAAQTHINSGAQLRSFAPARMIEVRPGLWVGSYQCVTDLDRGGRDCSSGI